MTVFLFVTHIVINNTMDILWVIVFFCKFEQYSPECNKNGYWVFINKKWLYFYFHLIYFISFNTSSSLRFSEYKRAKFLCLVFGICGVNFNPTEAAIPDLKTIHQWSQLEFDYETEAARQADIDQGLFIPGVPAPIDVDVYYSRK